MEKPCTCGGDNPNCYRCFGTGFYTPQDSQSSLRSDAVNQVENIFLNKRSHKKMKIANFDFCQICGLQVENIQKHTKRSHTSIKYFLPQEEKALLHK